jgi:hypothetical protein
MKRDEILFKPKVEDLENLHGIPWTFVKVMDKKFASLSANIKCMNES